MMNNPLCKDYLEITTPKTSTAKNLLPSATQTQQTTTSFSGKCQFEGVIPKGKASSSHLTYFQQGFLIAYTLQNNRPWGPALLIMPNGTSAFFTLRYRIQGWACVRKTGTFEVFAHYKGGRFEGPQFLHDCSREVALHTTYSKGMLRQVSKCCSTKQLQFTQLLSDRRLVEIFSQEKLKQFLRDQFYWVDCPLGYYAGQVEGKIPNGLGLLKAGNDIFMGQFEGGLLHGQGTITLPNGDHYYGSIEHGTPAGLGVYNRKGEILYKYEDNQITAKQFRESSPVPSFYSSSLRELFSPIVDFCLKMSEIESQGERSGAEDFSLVDIVVEGEPTGRSPSPRSSSDARPEPERQELFDELSAAKLTRHRRVPSEEKVKKQTVKEGHKKKERVLATDQEWQNVMQELEGHSLGCEDGFLLAEEHDVRQGEVQKREELMRGNLGRPMRENMVSLSGGDKQVKTDTIDKFMKNLAK